MKSKTILLTLITFFISSNVLAGGSKAPSKNPSQFVESYGNLIEGEKLVLENETIGCPQTFSINSYTHENGRTDLVLTNQFIGRLVAFPAVNSGTFRNGRNFQESYTTSKSLVYREGFEYWTQGEPARPPYRPGRPPELVTVLEFGFNVTMKGDNIELTSNSYRSKCVYRK